MGFGVHTVHPQQIRGEQRRFLSAHAGPDLHNDAAVIAFIPGQQQHTDFLLQGFPLMAEVLRLQGRHLPDLRILVLFHGFRLFQLTSGPEPGTIGLSHRLQLLLLLQELGRPIRFLINATVQQQGFYLLQSLLHLRQLFKHAFVPLVIKIFKNVLIIYENIGKYKCECKSENRAYYH